MPVMADYVPDRRAVDAATETRKRLFVLCDGTAQDGVNKTRPLTNVATLARCLAPIDNNGFLQVVYYDSGVGNGTSKRTMLVDGATGRGISAKIRNAYSFLSHNYNFERHWDETVLVGFSRGAFAVQCLAAFISDAGLLQKQHLYYLRGLFTLWSYQEVPGGRERFNVEKGRLQRSGLLHPVDITACALWDTVSSLGIRWQFPRRPLSFVGETVPTRVKHAFQALALDEMRRDFLPVIWQGPADKATDVSQCWFLGSHGDVGGNGDAALGMMSFIWMVGMLQDKIRIKFDESEIARHLKHRFLEWDFAVSTFLGTFKETRTLSTRPHAGYSTPPRWYWRVLGQSPRDKYLGQPSDLPTEIHFSVRLAMAEDKKSSRLLRSWSTSWSDQTDSIPATVQWRRSRSPTDDGAVATLNENHLNKEGTEYKLLFKWSHNQFPLFSTDRGDFVRLQEAVRAEGSNLVLDKFKKLLKDRMKFGDDGRLAKDKVSGINK